MYGKQEAEPEQWRPKGARVHMTLELFVSLEPHRTYSPRVNLLPLLFLYTGSGHLFINTAEAFFDPRWVITDFTNH